MTTAARTEPLRFGANYTPSQGWMHWWLDPDFDALARDLDALAGLGLDHLRVFPMWPYIQPNRSLIRPAALDQLRRLAQAAGERGLDICVDAIQGHMSSYDFLPAWMTTWHQRNMFTDAEAIDGQVALVTALGRTLADLPNFLGLNTGNEVNQFSGAPHPSPQPCTPAEAQAWLEALDAAAVAAAPGKVHTHAEYDAVWYLDDHPFVPAHASRIGAMTTIHSWVFNGTAQRYGGMSPESLHHAEYLLELSRAFATDPHRQVWLQEVGAPLNCMTADEAPDFAEATVRAAARCEGLWGVTWWCSHDVARELADFPELEYSLGLLDSGNGVKPLGTRVAETMAELRWAQPAVRDATVSIEVDAAGVPVSREALGPGGAVFDEWMGHIRAGQIPALTLTARDSSIEARQPSLAR